MATKLYRESGLLTAEAEEVKGWGSSCLDREATADVDHFALISF